MVARKESRNHATTQNFTPDILWCQSRAFMQLRTCIFADPDQIQFPPLYLTELFSLPILCDQQPEESGRVTPRCEELDLDPINKDLHYLIFVVIH
ncbi:hypothetical protein VTP01DRAFT_2825 [Rhizomucor pusillus]|uniref:uncharacterized protein n=1 Tax=Rhizomucor pusillus TaxID=4840 RepID=UPI0037421290